MRRTKADEDHYDTKETERRRDAALKRMLSTPHKPHKPIGKKKATKKKNIISEKGCD
jgi:hypothetical protein